MPVCVGPNQEAAPRRALRRVHACMKRARAAVSAIFGMRRCAALRARALHAGGQVQQFRVRIMSYERQSSKDDRRRRRVMYRIFHFPIADAMRRCDSRKEKAVRGLAPIGIYLYMKKIPATRGGGNRVSAV